jgi:hypothetical protein
MTNKDIKKFNVIEYNFNSRKVEHYDVLPYFRREWKDRPYYYNDNWEKIFVKTKNDLKRWIKDKSHYQFWARCEYECLIGPWPYNEEKIFDDLKKIDVHEQIMMNIDIITDVLYNEFEINE